MKRPEKGEYAGGGQGILSIPMGTFITSLRAQTLPDSPPQIGKIHSFSKIAVIFEPVMRF